MKSPVFIVLAVQNEAIKLHFKNAAEYAVERIARRQQRDIAVLEWKNLDLTAVNGFAAAPHFEVETPNRAFIFVADRFVSDRAPFRSTSFAERCTRDNRGERVGLIGIVRQPQRVP